MASRPLAAARRARGGHVVRSLVIGVFVMLGTSCKGPMAKIERVRDALETDDATAISHAVTGYSPCTDGPPMALLPKQRSPREEECFSAIANALGSKNGFHATPPDQAATATGAIVLLRDGRGDWLAHVDDWLGALKSGKGPGPDTLRLAVARSMAAHAVHVGRAIDDENAAREAMKSVAASVPGACPTYWLLGSAIDPRDLPLEHSPDHAACVHRDLGRREGPGASYGSEVFRALEGAMAVWRETERALRVGLSNAEPKAQKALQKKLSVIETATKAIATKKVSSTSAGSVIESLVDLHTGAGMAPWPTQDAAAGDQHARD